MNSENRRATPSVKPFPWRCGECKEKTVAPRRIEYTTDATHDGRTYTITINDLEIIACSKCGKAILPDESNRRITDVLRRSARVLTPEQIREGLRKLDLSQKDLAVRIEVAQETISRWLSGGAIQSRLADRALRVFFAFPEVREALDPERYDEHFGELAVVMRQGNEGPRTKLQATPGRLSGSCGLRWRPQGSPTFCLNN